MVYADDVTIEGVKIIGKTSAIGVGNNDTSKTPYFAEDTDKTPLYENYPEGGYSGFTLRNCEVTTAAPNGDIGSASLIQLDGPDATIENNVISDVDCDFAKIKVEKTNTTVTGNTFLNVSGTGELVGTNWDFDPPTNVIEDNDSYRAIVSNTTQLQEALDAAQDGDTILLEEGTYSVGSLRINHAVSFQGAGEETVLVGSINYYCGGEYDGEIKVSDLTVKAPENNTTDEQAIWWSYNAQDPLTGATLVVENCKVVDYLFGIGVNSSTTDCDVVVDNLMLENVWCGANVSEKTNTIQSYDIAEGSDVVYEVQVFGGGSAVEANTYYKTWEDCQEDTGRANPALDSNDKKPLIKEGNWPAVAEADGYYYGSVQKAVDQAEEGATIHLKAGTYEIGRLDVKKLVNMEGAGAEETVLKGCLVYSVDATEEAMSVSNLTLQADDSNNEKAIIWSMRTDSQHTGTLTDCDLTVDHCIIKDFKYGVALDTNASSCNLAVTNTVFENTWCGVSTKTESTGDLVLEQTTTDGEYIIQAFGAAASGEGTENKYYETVEDYEAGQGVDGSETGTYVSNSQQLQAALALANPGDTIKLGAGVYELAANQWGGTPVNLVGAGAGKTIIADALWRGGVNGAVVEGVETLLVEGITFQNVDGIDNWSNTGFGFTQINGCTITVKDCVFDGWQYGVHMNGANPGTTINLENVDFVNTFIGMSAQISEGTGLGTITNVTTTDGAMAVQVFGENEDYHYYTIDAFETARGEAAAPAIAALDHSALTEGVDFENVDGNLKGYVVTEGESIQDAIDKLADANGKNILVVAPGTYDEEITINKSITLRGANVGVNPNTQERGEETVLGKVTVQGENLDVVLDGLKFSGDYTKAAIESSYNNCAGTNLTVQNCVAEDLNAPFVFTYSDDTKRLDKVTVKDNQVTNITGENTAFNLWAASEHEITGNVVENIGLGAFNLDSTVGDVLFENNTINNVGGCGLQIANQATDGTVEILDNKIDKAQDAGIRVYGNPISSAFVIEDNEMNDCGHAITFYNDGDPENDTTIITGAITSKNNTHNGEGVAIEYGEGATTPEGQYKITVKNGDEVVAEYLASADAEGKATVTLPAALTRSGYTFRGWSDGDTVYSAEEDVTVEKDTTFEASWKKKSDSGSGSPDISGGGGSASSSTKYDVIVEDTENGKITLSDDEAKKGDEVTITVTPDEGYVLDKLTVLDEDGDEVDVEENADGTFTFTMPSDDVTISATFQTEEEAEATEETKASQFVDVLSTDWFYTAVQYVAENGLMSGVGDNYFAPNGTTTREMLAMVLYNLAGQPEVTAENPFSDVAAGQWYTDAIVWAAKTGVVAGYEDGTFGVGDNITREQLAAMLYRYASMNGADVSVGSSLVGFADGNTVSGYAVEAVQWAVGTGILSGDGTNLMPQSDATRAQVASMLMRYCQNVLN